MKSLVAKSPEKISDLLQVLKECPLNYILLAGGTDLLVRSNKTIEKAEMIINLSEMQELRYIKMFEGELRIGAGTSFTEISESDLIKKYGLCLAQSAALVGSPQIRNRATIGGNVANCSPAADSIPALIALNATLGTVNSDGKSTRVSMEEFLSWEKGRLNKEKAFIEYFGIPLNEKAVKSGFSRIGARSEVTISKLSIAIAFNRTPEGDIQQARVAMGAVGKTAVRVSGAEKLIEGRKLDENLMADLGADLTVELEESLRGRASMTYKRRAVLGVVQDLYFKLLEI